MPSRAFTRTDEFAASYVIENSRTWGRDSVARHTLDARSPACWTPTPTFSQPLDTHMHAKDNRTILHSCAYRACAILESSSAAASRSDKVLSTEPRSA